jgi:hypothetical protein
MTPTYWSKEKSLTNLRNQCVSYRTMWEQLQGNTITIAICCAEWLYYTTWKKQAETRFIEPRAFAQNVEFLLVFSGSNITSGEASSKIWSCYANFKSLSLFISLEIDCFHGQLTRKYLHSMTKLSRWLRYWI